MRIVTQLIVVMLLLLIGSLPALMPPISRAASQGDCQNLIKSIQPLLDKSVAQGLPGVSVAIYTPSCGLIQEASGWAVRQANTVMIPQEHFRIASCSKVFLGVVVMQLAAEGKISLSDPIAKYISVADAANIHNANQATLRQLMNHTSGIYDYFGEKFNADAASHPGKYYTIEEALKYAYGKPAAFSPAGSSYNYSNTDTLLLAAMVEKVTGAPFTKVLRDRIFTPLTLNNTYNDYAESEIAPLAHGYDISPRLNYTDYTNINQGYGLPDGGIVSNAADMVTFIRALLHEGKLLNPATLDEMLTIDPSARNDQEGLNIFIYSDYYGVTYGPMLGHSGGITGYLSEMYYFPNRDIAITLLTNSSGYHINKKWNRLFDQVALTVLKQQ